MLIGFFHLKIRLPKIKILPENGRISPKAFKSVRRTPDVCNLWFVICNFPQRGLILVLLEEPLQRMTTLKHVSVWSVSILVLLEEPLQHWTSRKPSMSWLSFNPCFTGRTTSTVTFFCSGVIIVDVSILVLLEEPLQPLTPITRCKCGRSFNPCFTGRTTSTSRTKWFYLFRKSFQSLFYWKNHFNIVKRLSLKKFTVVSILVLLEEPLQRM